jgi:hypothetical protein
MYLQHVLVQMYQLQRAQNAGLEPMIRCLLQGSTVSSSSVANVSYV